MVADDISSIMMYILKRLFHLQSTPYYAIVNFNESAAYLYFRESMSLQLSNGNSNRDGQTETGNP